MQASTDSLSQCLPSTNRLHTRAARRNATAAMMMTTEPDRATPLMPALDKVNFSIHSTSAAARANTTPIKRPFICMINIIRLVGPRAADAPLRTPVHPSPLVGKNPVRVHRITVSCTRINAGNPRRPSSAGGARRRSVARSS